MTFWSLQCSWHFLNLLVFEALCSYTVCSYKREIVKFFFHKLWFLSPSCVYKSLNFDTNGVNNFSYNDEDSTFLFYEFVFSMCYSSTKPHGLC